MKLISKRIVTGLSMLLMQFAFANSGDAVAQNCAPKDCAKPCAKPCPPVCFERGYPNANCCFPSAYNEPANYDLAPSAWEFWVDASFTYWDAQQEGMDLAYSSTILTSTALSPTNENGFVFQETQYKPGFKVGLGMDLGRDDWSGLIEYTWFRSTTSTGAQAAPADSRGGTAIWVMENWVRATAAVGVNGVPFATTFSSDWRLNMDLLDVALTRPYYQGTHLIVAPFGGMRGQWIRQKLDMSLTAITTALATTEATATTKSNSWAVGPRAGFNTKWHLGWGFRFEGDVAASLLFTQYTTIKNTQTPIIASGNTIGGVITDYNCLRAGNEMNLGIGWGSYFDCRNYHLDLLATYDFQVFWNQNMMKRLIDSLNSYPSGGSANNLYLQGLTLKAQFDF